MQFEITKPSTITVVLNKSELPCIVEVFKKGKGLYFFRSVPAFDEAVKIGWYLSGAGNIEVKINIKHKGEYVLSKGYVSFIEPMVIRPLEISLPTPDRQREKPFKVKFNPALTKEKGTPARHFTGTGIIEVGPFFKSLPFPIRYFILLHEYGHFFYQDESACDMFALNHFIKSGYNNSTAVYALTKVLRHNEPNTIRILNLSKNLNRR